MNTPRACWMVIPLLAIVFSASCATNSNARNRDKTAQHGEVQPVAFVDSLDPIKAEFNAHADSPRVLLLVSPTCSECVYGAEVVRKSIMDRFAASGIYAVVVWERMLASDNDDAAREAALIFDGVAATQFYDRSQSTGWAFERELFHSKWDEVEAALPSDHWLRIRVERKPDPMPEWDVYMLYHAGVLWESTVPKPDAFIRHIGRDEQGRARYFRDHFNAPPSVGDLHEAMERMGRDVLWSARAVKIELLGFPSCPNTPLMREQLRAGLAMVGQGFTFRDVNQEALAATDARRGWPTPTVLINGVDLFGMDAPSAGALPSMSCRLYLAGVPDAEEIAAQLREFLRSFSIPDTSVK